jgi:hypothetical protein
VSFFWFQRTGGEEQWHEALAEHRTRIIQDSRPAFVTVLDAHSSPDPSWGPDEYAKMKYSGPLYFDWDAEDVSETIPKFQQFLVKLQEDYGVNLRSLRLYATGGRGFHCEVPVETFCPKFPKGGVANLPYVYREMAMELVVDTMDMRVYTGRKGRMWRVPGVERSNGKYKVPLTVDQALSMTTELYAEVCSKPLPEPERDIPVMSLQLASLFVKSQGKIEEAMKRRAKSTGDAELLAKFKGEFPPTVERIMRGEGIAPGAGFQKIATQLGITANALGKSAEQLIEACEGLIKNHSSDSQRYNSPRKRREELRRMWEYTHDNPCYVFSRGAIRSLCEVDAPTSDLDGVNAQVGIGHVPDNDDDTTDELPEDVAQEVSAASQSLLEGMMITNTGIYKRTQDGARMLSNLSFRKPSKMVDAIDGLEIGFEADILSDGKRKGRQLVRLDRFTSRANLSKFCSGYGAVFSGTDTQAGVVQLMLSRSADKGGRVLYVVHKEGLDVIQNPVIKDKAVKDVLWVAPDAVLCNNAEVQYKFQPAVSSDAVFKTDLHHAPVIENTPDNVEWLRALMDINNPVTVAQMLGWFVSCFHRQFYHLNYQQFPLLHPNGPAGCGKTLTTTLLGRMFHNTGEPVLKGCSPGASTQFALKSAWTGSASIPVLLDEYKPAEMGPQRTEFLLQHFRMLYNQAAGSSGGMSRGGADSSFRDVTEYTYSAPTAFLAETQEMQTAIVQRTLPVAFSPYDAQMHTKQFDLAKAGADRMPQLGALLLRLSLNETLQSRFEALEPLRRDLRASLDRAVHDRQVYNLAVVLAGLDFLDGALVQVFGDELRNDIDRLRQSVYDHKADVAVQVMSESAKVLNDLSLISRSELDTRHELKELQHYVVMDGHIDISMRETFVKYHAWCKDKGFQPLYTSADSFMSGMAKFPAVIDRVCLDSPLKKGGQSRVFRFSIDKMLAEGVQMFRSKAYAET